ncbi:MAG TPA: T9SS type A sorting domain-containing protein, partial [Bacteroidia bacterium]|nr:T9SS type A sorting domain-containing protein [Bacteroidia bacterium]
AFLVNAMQGQSLMKNNLLTGRINRKSCIIGHNMGGGCALLASSYNKNITTYITLAPAETNPSAVNAATKIYVPVLNITAGNDCVTPASENASPMYEALSGNCKMLINIKGGSHCQFANFNNNCNAAEQGCSVAAISRTQQQSIAMRYILLWLDFRLKNNCTAHFTLMDETANDNAIETRQACNNAVVCVSPANKTATDIGPTTALLKWKANTCAATYELRYKNSNVLQWISLGTIGAVTSYMLTGLTPGMSYDWSLRTICDDDATTISTWGNKKTFTTATQQLIGFNAENKQDVSFDINPNPSFGKFSMAASINALKPIVISVYSSIGKKVSETTIMPKETELTHLVDLSNESSGIYFVRINYGDIIDTQRIVKR